MPVNTSTGDMDDDEPDRDPPNSLTPKQRQMRQWYYTGVRLQSDGREEEALDYFKRIYEIDYRYKDVAKIVEDSYRT